MNATDQLKAEHEGVKLMLVILNKICDRLARGERVNAEHLEEILEFVKVFVDKCHHGKEEDVLFPELEKAGVPREEGPVGVMLQEHSKGREHVRRLTDAVKNYNNGDQRAAAAIVDNAKAYTRILLAHIDKENGVLYPIADARIPKDIHDRMIGQFERIEAERIGRGKHEEFHKMLAKLKRVYLD